MSWYSSSRTTRNCSRNSAANARCRPHDLQGERDLVGELDESAATLRIRELLGEIEQHPEAADGPGERLDVFVGVTPTPGQFLERGEPAAMARTSPGSTMFSATAELRASTAFVTSSTRLPSSTRRSSLLAMTIDRASCQADAAPSTSPSPSRPISIALSRKIVFANELYVDTWGDSNAS